MLACPWPCISMAIIPTALPFRVDFIPSFEVTLCPGCVCVWGGGGEPIYITLYCRPQIDPAIKMGSD